MRLKTCLKVSVLLISVILLIACVRQPALPGDQTPLSEWFSQRGLETRELKIENWPADSGASAGQPQRISFKTPKPTGELETWRTSLRDDLSAWLTGKGHPEGGCTSVDLKPETDTVAVEILVVCR